MDNDLIKRVDEQKQSYLAGPWDKQTYDRFLFDAAMDKYMKEGFDKMNELFSFTEKFKKEWDWGKYERSLEEHGGMDEIFFKLWKISSIANEVMLNLKRMDDVNVETNAEQHTDPSGPGAYAPAMNLEFYE